MANIKFKGVDLKTIGELPKIGDELPDFTLAKKNLSDLTKKDIIGKKVVFNIFPSLDTEVCAATVKKFNEIATKLPDVIIICASKDLPFAQDRFCSANKIEKIILASGFRGEFGKNFGVEIVEGPLSGLYSRAIVCCDKDGKIIHNEQVTEITKEPDYEKVIAKLS